MSININIFTKTEYLKQKTIGDDIRLFFYEVEHYQSCKVEILDEKVVGTIIIPKKSDFIHKEEVLGYCFVDNTIDFIDDSGIVKTILEQIDAKDYDSAETYFFAFAAWLIREEDLFLQRYDEAMADVETSLVNYRGEDLSKNMIRCRKELQYLYSHYHQLLEMLERIESVYGSYKKLTKRIERLLLEVKELREYSIQIRELYQTQVSVRQNKVMQLLTVITTIFMPLNLLTGWYGMNFVSMPELMWEYGYYAMLVVSILVVGVEVLYLKRKKWFL